MTFQARTSLWPGIAVAIALVVSSSAFAANDADAAKKLAKNNNCFKCHAVDKDKDGPSYKKVAEKYRGKSDGEEQLIDRITSGKKVKFPDGHEDEHRIIDTQDMGEIRNLVDWILSL